MATLINVGLFNHELSCYGMDIDKVAEHLAHLTGYALKTGQGRGCTVATIETAEVLVDPDDMQDANLYRVMASVTDEKELLLSYNEYYVVTHTQDEAIDYALKEVRALHEGDERAKGVFAMIVYYKPIDQLYNCDGSGGI